MSTDQNPNTQTTASESIATTGPDTAEELDRLRDVLPTLTHPDGRPVRILVVDDEPMIADLIAMGARMTGWQTRIAHDGEAAVELAKDFAPDVVALDWMLPGMDGLTVLERIRAHWPEIPVLILTAKDATEDRIKGLSAGADDYVTKPFSMQELLLRLHRLVQRAGMVAQTGDELVAGDLVMNTRTRVVTRGGEEIDLTATQFALLRYLMENVRTVLSKQEILENVWHHEVGGRVNIVELYVSYLRKKIDAGRDPMIHTVRGSGYVLRPA